MFFVQVNCFTVTGSSGRTAHSFLKAGGMCNFRPFFGTGLCLSVFRFFSKILFLSFWRKFDQATQLSLLGQIFGFKSVLLNPLQSGYWELPVG